MVSCQLRTVSPCCSKQRTSQSSRSTRLKDIAKLLISLKKRAAVKRQMTAALQQKQKAHHSTETDVQLPSKSITAAVASNDRSTRKNSIAEQMKSIDLLYPPAVVLVCWIKATLVPSSTTHCTPVIGRRIRQRLAITTVAGADDNKQNLLSWCTD